MAKSIADVKVPFAYPIGIPELPTGWRYGFISNDAEVYRADTSRVILKPGVLFPVPTTLKVALAAQANDSVKRLLAVTEGHHIVGLEEVTYDGPLASIISNRFHASEGLRQPWRTNKVADEKAWRSGALQALTASVPILGVRGGKEPIAMDGNDLDAAIAKGPEAVRAFIRANGMTIKAAVKK